MRTLVVAIPFNVRFHNVDDRNVWKHAIETIQILQRQVTRAYKTPMGTQMKSVVLPRPYVIGNLGKLRDDLGSSSPVAFYIVSHGTTQTVGNDADIVMTEADILRYLKELAQVICKPIELYLLTCPQLARIQQPVVLYGIDGYVGHVEGKHNNIYVADMLGGPGRWRLEQRLVRIGVGEAK